MRVSIPMVSRTPSRLPFLILLIVGALAAQMLPNALFIRNPLRTMTIILTIIASACAMFTAAAFFSPVIHLNRVLVSVLWLLPAVLGAYLRNPSLVLLSLIPLWVHVSPYLPNATPPRFHAIISALLIQGAAVALLASHFGLGAMLFSLALLLILWAKEPQPDRPLLRLPSGIVALLLTILLLNPPSLVVGNAGGVSSVDLKPPPSSAPTGKSTNAHLGLILRPEVRRKEAKLPPAPRFLPNDLSYAPSIPLEIPFSGVYWLFQLPLPGPPVDSPVIQGAPGDFKFHSDDFTPLRLDAHQLLSTPIPTRRLAAIDLKLASADIYPNSIDITLILRNAETPQYQMRLGTHRLGSEFGAQTLHYKVPPDPYISDFNEFRIIVNLSGTRRHIAPRLAFQSFRLYTR